MIHLKTFQDLFLESIDYRVEEIEDYFQELNDHKNDKLPITVSVEKHRVNTKKGERINRKFSEKDKYKADGYKITILFDTYDQVYVKNVTSKAINRLRRDYNIHYNQISKTGNGYNSKEIPVHGTNRVAYVSDPIWKQTITITPKILSESFLDDIEYVTDISIEDDDSFIFISQFDIKFDLLRKEVVGQGDYHTKYSRNKINCYYGSLSNADFLGSYGIKYTTIVDAKQVYIDSRKELTKNLVEEKFNKLISLYPSIMIFGRFVIQHTKETDLYNRYELIFVNPDDYKK